MKGKSKQVIWFPLSYKEQLEREKEDQFYLKHPEKSRPVKPEHEFIPALEYCGWLPSQTKKEYELKKQVQSCHPYCCFNHLVGMPTIKYTDENDNVIGESAPIEFYHYEKTMVEEYEATNYFGDNKCRGAGASELITIRHLAYKYITTRVKDRKGLIMAGTNVDAANTLMHRIKEVCDKIPFVYRFPPKSDYPHAIFFKFGMILSLAANPNIVRSYENVGDIVYEESAFWKLNNDIPVLMAGEPHVGKSSAHIGCLSTPNGQRGFMWTKIFDPEIKSKYHRHVLNWREVCGLPVQNLEEISDYDFIRQQPILKIDISDRSVVEKYFVKKYKTDKEYKKWFDGFFQGKPLSLILSIKFPVLNPLEVIATYFTDREEYDQEYDNQFTLSESRAFGDFSEVEFEPEEFE